MNLYKISQDVNNNYDTYDSAVVVAANLEDAKMIHPSGEYVWGDAPGSVSGGKCWIKKEEIYEWSVEQYEWTSPENVKAKLIGLADPTLEAGTVIVASYNAG